MEPVPIPQKQFLGLMEPVIILDEVLDEIPINDLPMRPIFSPIDVHNSLIKLVNQWRGLGQFWLDEEGFGVFQSSVQGEICEADPIDVQRRCELRVSFGTNPWNKQLILKITAPFTCSDTQAQAILQIFGIFDQYLEESITILINSNLEHIVVTNDDLTKIVFPSIAEVETVLQWRNFVGVFY